MATPPSPPRNPAPATSSPAGYVSGDADRADDRRPKIPRRRETGQRNTWKTSSRRWNLNGAGDELADCRAETAWIGTTRTKRDRRDLDRLTFPPPPPPPNFIFSRAISYCSRKALNRFDIVGKPPPPPPPPPPPNGSASKLRRNRWGGAPFLSSASKRGGGGGGGEKKKKKPKVSKGEKVPPIGAVRFACENATCPLADFFQCCYARGPPFVPTGARAPPRPPPPLTPPPPAPPPFCVSSREQIWLFFFYPLRHSAKSLGKKDCTSGDKEAKLGQQCDNHHCSAGGEREREREKKKKKKKKKKRGKTANEREGGNPKLRVGKD